MAGPVPIAIVMTSFAPGGTERQMIELVRRLDPSRWTVHVACFHTRGSWFERLPSTAAIVQFPVRSFGDLPRFGAEIHAFSRWCRSRDIAICHTADMPGNIFGLLGARLAGVPVRIASRREINPGRPLWKLGLQRAAYGAAHMVVANSRAAAERLHRERVPRRKVAVIPNGLDSISVRPARPRPRMRLVITVANLRAEKGHDVLIDAAPAILQRAPATRFIIAGDGPQRAALEARAAARGVAGAFSFIGHCVDVARQLAEADLFVLPSRSEALPNALLEAMAAGLPVIASDVGGVGEIVHHRETGILVPPGNAPALARAVCSAMDDPAASRALGVAARTLVAARFSFDRMVTSFERLYLSQLSDRRVG